MLERNEIHRIALDVARTNLPASAIKGTAVEPAIGSTGEEILRITIVIEADAVDRISGESTLNTLVQMRKRIREAGDERLPIVEYATEEDLQDSGDP